ncbi:hypothetical protein ACJRO7_023279 [Eucalyptus globulus]|uniref:Strictosidine synthase n=1 Tax=Eucalyptus globulus TaxID=34317 RepID=A0ABD3KAR3_EUCGL
MARLRYLLRIFIVLIIIICCPSSSEARRLPLLEEGLLLSAASSGIKPLPYEGHLTAIDKEKLSGLHVANEGRVLWQSVPSPGVGH